MVRSVLIAEKQIDYALAGLFLVLVGVSVYSSTRTYDNLIRVEVLASIPLNLLAAYSFIVRARPLVPTYASEIWVPMISFLLPFFILNNVAFLPADYSFWWGIVVAVPGVLIAVAAILTLRRAFAILPSVRGVITGGPYRYIRHPLYLGEIIYIVGLMLLRFNLLSIGLLALSMIALLVRIRMEEKKLSVYPVYRDYLEEVRYRLIPGLY